MMAFILWLNYIKIATQTVKRLKKIAIKNCNNCKKIVIIKIFNGNINEVIKAVLNPLLFDDKISHKLKALKAL